MTPNSAFASLPMAVAAGGIVGGKAAVDRIRRIAFESRTFAAAATASAAPARCRARRRLSGGLLSRGLLRFDYRNHAEEGNSARKS